MADITFKVTGLDEVVNLLNQGGDAGLDDEITNSLNELRDEIDSTTTSLCPVDTGALRDSIDIQVSGLTLTAIAGEDYASYVDQGTINMDAQPFFEDPINEAVAQWQQELEQKLLSSLQNK